MPQVIPLFLPAFAGATGAITVAGIAITTAAGTLTLAGVALNVAGSLAFSALTSKLFAPDPPSISPPSLLVNTAQDTAPRVMHYGLIKVGYSIPLWHVKNGTLSRIIVHGHGEFAEYVNYFLDKLPVTLDAQGWVQEDQYKYLGKSKVRIISRAGVVPSLHYPELVDQIAEWTLNHRLDGLAQSLLMASLPPQAAINAMYPTREPKLEVVAKTSKVLDPRTGLVKYSDNLALCALDYELSPDGGNLAGRVDLDSYVIAADRCDLSMPLADGGAEPQYRFAGSIDLNEEPADVRIRFAGASAGEHFIGPSGHLGFRVGGWVEPTFTLTEDMLISYDQDFDPDPVESYNTAAFEYVDPDLNFTVVQGDPWVDAERVAREGENTSTPFISAPSHRQCRHVTKEMMGRDNPKNELNVVCKPKALPGLYEKAIRVDLPSYGVSGIYRVRDRDVPPNLSSITFKLSLVEQGDTDLGLSEQGVAPTYETLEGSEILQAPKGFNAAPLEVEVTASTIASGFGAAWAAPDRDDLTALLEYSESGIGNWIKIPVASGVNTGASGALPDLKSYDVRCAWVTAGERVGPYAVETGVQAQAIPPMPVVPTGLSILDLGGGVAQVSVTASATLSNWKTQILRDGVLITEVSSEPGVEIAVIDESGVGSFSWEARAVGVSGAQSAAMVGPVGATIT